MLQGAIVTIDFRDGPAPRVAQSRQSRTADANSSERLRIHIDRLDGKLNRWLFLRLSRTTSDCHLLTEKGVSNLKSSQLRRTAWKSQLLLCF